MEKEKNIHENYFKKKAPELIEKLKDMVDECLKIVGEEVGGKLSADKKKNVVLGKKEAAEAARWALGEIDALERQLNPENYPEEEKKDETKSSNKNKWAEQMAE